MHSGTHTVCTESHSWIVTSIIHTKLKLYILLYFCLTWQSGHGSIELYIYKTCYSQTAIFILIVGCGLYPVISKSSNLKLSISGTSRFIFSVGNGSGSLWSCEHHRDKKNSHILFDSDGVQCWSVGCIPVSKDWTDKKVRLLLNWIG